MVKTLEICVDSYESAMNALFGRADRLELCRDLTVGGLTPSAGFVASVKKMQNPCKELYRPIFVLIRSHSRDFLYNSYEVMEMQENVKLMKKIGVDGFVFGALDIYGNVDKAICKELLSAANGVPCTFHRAFDLILDKTKALEDLIELGFARVLTAGCGTDALNGVQQLSLLVKQAQGRIIVMPGGNVTEANISEILTKTCADEIHSSGRDPRFPSKNVYLCCPTVVQKMKKLCMSLSKLNV